MNAVLLGLTFEELVRLIYYLGSEIDLAIANGESVWEDSGHVNMSFSMRMWREFAHIVGTTTDGHDLIRTLIRIAPRPPQDDTDD